MPFTALLHSLASALEMLVLSWTSHARLMKAEHPIDFDLILKRTIREVKFHSETVSKNTLTFPKRRMLIIFNASSCLRYYCKLMTSTPALDCAYEVPKLHGN